MTTREFSEKFAIAEQRVGESMQRHIIAAGLVAVIAGLAIAGWQHMDGPPEPRALPLTPGTSSLTGSRHATDTLATPATARQAPASTVLSSRVAEPSQSTSSMSAAAFPRGLAEHAALALQRRDGHAAMEVAKALEVCRRLPYLLLATQAAVERTASPEGSKRDAQDLADQQALVALCQTAPPGLQDQRRTLYALALAQQVPGAASAYYDPNDPQTQQPAVMRQLRVDAENGDLMAMSALAESRARPGVLSDHEVAVYRLTLMALTKTQEWGPAAEMVLAHVKRDRALRAELDEVSRGNDRQAAAVRATIEQHEVYDLRQVTPQARTEAQALVQTLLKRRRQSAP